MRRMQTRASIPHHELGVGLVRAWTPARQPVWRPALRGSLVLRAWSLGPLVPGSLYFREGVAEAAPGGFKVFGEDAGFAYGCHEVGVAHPARHGVQMQMAGDARARGLADVHSKIEAMGRIDAIENAFGTLRQIDELVRGGEGQRRQPVKMRVGHDHDVARGVGKGVEADEAMFGAHDQPAGSFGLVAGHSLQNGVVDGGDEVAEDAAQVAGPGIERLRNARAHGAIRRCDVSKTPGSPEMVHCKARCW